MNCIKCGTPRLSRKCPACEPGAEAAGQARAVAIRPPGASGAAATATFQIILTGLHPDVERAAAITRLAALFKATMEQVDALLAIPEHVLKAGLSADMAVRFQAAIRAAGGACHIQPEKPASPVLSRQVSAAAKPAQTAADGVAVQPVSPWVMYERLDLDTATWEAAMPYYDAVIAGDLDDRDASSAGTHKKHARREKYLELFREMHEKKKGWLSPNICGVFFGVFWFAYRRMSVIAYGFLGASLLMGMVAELYFGKQIDRMAFPFALVLGLMGNYLYFLSAKSRMRSAMSLPREQAIASLKKEGGTSASAVWMIIVVLLLYAFFVQPFTSAFVKAYARALSGKKPVQASVQKPAAKSASAAGDEAHRNPEDQLQPGQAQHLSVDVLRKMADGGDVQAQLVLGQRYAKGTGVPQDSREAAAWYRKAAEQGHAQAQSLLGFYYIKGEGVPQDYHEAVAWLRKAAEQGDAGAQYNLGLMYKKGNGVMKDDQEAMVWFRKAAEQGDPKVKPMAQNNIGVGYSAGEGVPKDPQEAVAWYRKSAEQGNATSQANLGHRYESGEGVPRDYQQAMTWYLKAAEQNDANAQFRLGVMYEMGRGTRPDDRQAADWYSKAAVQGHAQAQYRLGVKYANGHGVEKDMVQALKWFTLAALSVPESEQARARAESEMSANQIQQARNLARESGAPSSATP